MEMLVLDAAVAWTPLTWPGAVAAAVVTVRMADRIPDPLALVAATAKSYAVEGVSPEMIVEVPLMLWLTSVQSEVPAIRYCTL